MIGLLTFLMALQLAQLQTQVIVLKYTATQPMNVTVVIDSYNAVTNVTEVKRSLNTNETLILPIEVKYLPGAKVDVKIYSEGNVIFEKTFTFTGRCVEVEISEHSLEKLYPSSFNSGDAVVIALKNVCPVKTKVEIKYNLPFKMVNVNECVRTAEVVTTGATVPPIYFPPLKVLKVENEYQLACIYLKSFVLPNNVTAVPPMSSENVVLPVQKPPYVFSLTPSLSASVRLGSVIVNGEQYPVSVTTLNLAPIALLVLAVALIFFLIFR